MEKSKDEILRAMQIGERIDDWLPNLDVVRVPGGWLFIVYAFNPYNDGATNVSTSFVPYVN